MQFVVIWAMLLSALNAGNFMMHDRVCANPVSMNNIFVVCNDINFSNANDEYAVYMYELNKELETLSTTKLMLNDLFVEKAIKINTHKMFLIAETRSKCVEVLAVETQSKNIDSVLEFCDSAELSLEDEYHPHTVLFDDGSLLFSMEREGVDAATVQLLYLKATAPKKYEIVRLNNYKNYDIFKMMPYKEGAVVMLRSQQRANDAVLLKLTKNKEGSFDTSVLYETHTQMLTSFDIDADRIFLYGNKVSSKMMSLFLYEIDTKGAVHRHLDEYPMAFQPTGLKVSKSKGLFLAGMLTNTKKQPSDLGLMRIEIDHGNAMVSYERLERDISESCLPPLWVEDNRYMSLFFKDARQVVRIDPVMAQVKEKILLPVSHVLLIPNSPRFLQFADKVFLTYTAIEENIIKNIIQEVPEE